ncbi:hypothetical protein RvY_00476 [Ramazzottius varieornatus]|uniref:CFAP61 dimerisation domain-containing protein n=1 Tax=Ramazzottius varieornatus TaxID=947166 RepID=A0A1D1UDV3_RAMVA|nr:hypothetical protein RvY_00476 [Ramazzottius varieornatus]
MLFLRASDEKNAMYLLLFHLEPVYSTHLDYILIQCFRVLPGYDYLITEIPTASRTSLLLRKMVRVAMREGHFLHENLYALHRIALLRHDDVELIPGSPADIPVIQHFLQGKANHKALLDAFIDSTHYRTSRQASQLHTTVFRIAGTIIGFVIFGQETNLDYLQAQYNIDDFMYIPQHREQGHLRIFHYVITPLVNSFNQFILKELLRIHNASSYFYRFYPLDQQEERNDSFVCCLENLQLVRPRYPVLKYNESGDESDWLMLPTSQARDVQPPFALFHTNRRTLYDLREDILDRIVIIGASDMSLQVLRNLSLFPHVSFTNILLIDPHGVPIIDFLDKVAANGYRSARELFTARELCQLAVPTQCQIVYGRAVTMDKENRLLHVNAKTRIPFDWMVIGTGTQFLSFNINVDTDYISTLLNENIPNKPQRRMQMKSPLNNYFVMNNAFEVDAVVKDVQALLSDPSSKGYFVVYGNALEAYGGVASLLKRGVASDEILFVNPAPAYPESATVFSSMDLERWVKSEMFSQGVVVIMEWIAVAHNEGRGGDVIETVTFWTDEATFKTYQVQAFFNYSDRQMNPYTQSFLNSAHLILDKKVVVDEQFYAYRPRIMAAGSWCKFSRRHFVSNFEFNDVNSREIGDAVSMELLKNLCPEMFLLDAKKPEEKAVVHKDITAYPKLPQFRKPVVDNIALPFGWYYCNIRSPPNPIAGTATMTSSSEPDKKSKLRMDDRRLISTGCIADGNLCEIYLDKLYLIDQIVCVTQFAPPVDTLMTIHGMHEGWLELIRRFEDGYISSFFEYFQELWLSCILYDRFPALGGELRRLLLDDRGDGNNISVLQLVVQSFQNQEMAHSPNNQTLEEIARRLRVTGINMDIEKTMENFLECNNRHLPMYAAKDNVGEQLN